MDEPYRTLLGHFRHEVGLYFWDILSTTEAVMFLDEAGLRKVFDLQSPHQMRKLRWETGLIHSMLADDQKVIFAAFNAAATAWHLTEWIIEAWDDLPAQEISKGDYRGNVVQRCPDLEICRQISVGCKHRVVKQRNDPAIQASHMIKLYFRMKDGKITDGPTCKSRNVTGDLLRNQAR